MDCSGSNRFTECIDLVEFLLRFNLNYRDFQMEIEDPKEVVDEKALQSLPVRSAVRTARRTDAIRVSQNRLEGPP